MKLAFCLFKYFPFGGLQRDFLQIARECVRRGHQVDAFVITWEGELEPGISIHIMAVTAAQNHIRAQQFVAQLQPRLAEYDLVIGFNKMPGLDVYYAADTCYQAKIRRQRGAWYRLTPRYRHWVAYEKAVFAADLKTKILLLSKVQQIEFSDFYQTAPARFHLLPPGLTKDRMAPVNAADIRASVRRKWAIHADEFLLLLVGSGFKTKGLDRALLGYATLPNALRKRTFMYVIGEDNPKLFQRQAKKLGIVPWVKFLGGRNDVPDFLLAADLLVHPAYNENTGTVLLEALAAGLPVLTTDVCGYAGYVRDAQAGKVLSSPFQQTEFNQSLANMLSSDERANWRKNALEFTKQADIYSLSERAVEAIEGLNCC
jgi:UDP-glucose:(heptosyl)LPS alpha-1,3-glucosyltransferase